MSQRLIARSVEILQIIKKLTELLGQVEFQPPLPFPIQDKLSGRVQHNPIKLIVSGNSLIPN
jgi:hypothetical protein